MVVGPYEKEELTYQVCYAGVHCRGPNPYKRRHISGRSWLSHRPSTVEEDHHTDL